MYFNIYTYFFSVQFIKEVIEWVSVAGEREYLAARGKETKIRFWAHLSLTHTKEEVRLKLAQMGWKKKFFF